MTYSTVKGTQLGAPPACGSSDVTEQRNVAQNVVYLTVFLSPREAGTLELGLNGDLTEAPAWAPEGGGVRELGITRESPDTAEPTGRGRLRLEQAERRGQQAWILLRLSQTGWVTLAGLPNLSAQ